MPIKTFLQGDILTADEVNQFLMDQVVVVFADAAARDNAFGGAGEPVLTEGRFCYLSSTNSVQYYDGAQWQDAPQFALADGIVTAAKLASDSVTTVKIAALAVTAAKIASDAVTTAKILDSNVTTAKIADSAITSAKIADGAIVDADINASAAIDKTKISGTAITAADTGTVTSTIIADGTIVNADINASAAIELGKLADATIDEKSASYTLALTDKNKFIKMSITSTANTVTVPTNASVAFPIGSQIHIIQYGTGKTQVIPVSGTVTIYATPGAYLRTQYSSATLLKCDTNIWMLMGDLSAS